MQEPAAAMKGRQQRERLELAACYRLVAHFGMSDLIFTHISARVPGRDDALWINPYGCLFDELRASDLIMVDLAGQVLTRTSAPVNPAGLVIHTAIHGARREAA